MKNYEKLLKNVSREAGPRGDTAHENEHRQNNEPLDPAFSGSNFTILGYTKNNSISALHLKQKANF